MTINADRVEREWPEASLLLVVAVMALGLYASLGAVGLFLLYPACAGLLGTIIGRRTKARKD